MYVYRTAGCLMCHTLKSSSVFLTWLQAEKANASSHFLAATPAGSECAAAAEEGGQMSVSVGLSKFYTRRFYWIELSPT